MSLVISNHELVESRTYPYGFSPEVEAWREVVEDRDSDASKYFYIEVHALDYDTDPSVNLAEEPVVEDLISFLLGLSLSSGPKPLVRLSLIILTSVAVKNLTVFITGSGGRSVDRWSKGAINS
ncbi:hypothetical protein AYI68_g5305 [Smittium mucronatum]|uniref:Uncharacterized protein n=1 Tax=Smittium mucronatum TaxID=133383 RepID=A0A1R0GUL1_9FUNG|nr:hypothetical protein AYI68_g5305 [Smittium mucronatum]